MDDFGVGVGAGVLISKLAVLGYCGVGLGLYGIYKLYKYSEEEAEAEVIETTEVPVAELSKDREDLINKKIDSQAAVSIAKIKLTTDRSIAEINKATDESILRISKTTDDSITRISAATSKAVSEACAAAVVAQCKVEAKPASNKPSKRTYTKKQVAEAVTEAQVAAEAKTA